MAGVGFETPVKDGILDLAHVIHVLNIPLEGVGDSVGHDLVGCLLVKRARCSIFKVCCEMTRRALGAVIYPFANFGLAFHLDSQM